MNLSTTARAIVGLLSCFLAGCSATASKDIFQPNGTEGKTWTALERSTLASAQVGWANASAPFKRYLIIDDGEFLCAVRFVNYLRGQDADSGSLWSSGEETLTSAYEWNVLQRMGEKVQIMGQGKDIVRRTALSGVGRLVISGGYGNIKCGNRKFGWQYPAGINFSQSPTSKMRLSPTRWEKIEDIRLDDPRLVWYSFDQNRKQIFISVANL